MVLSSLLYIVSAKMWLIVKKKKKKRKKLMLNSGFPYSFNFVYWPPYLFAFFFFLFFYCIILIRKTSKQMYFTLAQGMYIMCEN